MALVGFLGHASHPGLDVAQQEESNAADQTDDLCDPEGRFPAVVLGYGAEGQPREEATNFQGEKKKQKRFANTFFFFMLLGGLKSGRTVGHQGNDGVWRSSEVRWGALNGYDSKQRDWTVGGEAESSTQAQDPHLKVQRRRRRLFGSNFVCVCVCERCSEGGLRVTLELSGVTVTLNRYMDTYMPAIMQIRRKWRGFP